MLLWAANTHARTHTHTFKHKHTDRNSARVGRLCDLDTAPALDDAEHEKPSSTLQAGEHPSPGAMFPSSHCSEGSLT